MSTRLILWIKDNQQGIKRQTNEDYGESQTQYFPLSYISCVYRPTLTVIHATNLAPISPLADIPRNPALRQVVNQCQIFSY